MKGAVLVWSAASGTLASAHKTYGRLRHKKPSSEGRATAVWRWSKLLAGHLGVCDDVTGALQASRRLYGTGYGTGKNDTGAPVPGTGYR